MKKQQGFSLVELMIVVAIIGALTAFAIPAYQDYVQRSEAMAGLATLKSLQTPAQLEEQETGVFPTSLADIGARSNMNALGTVSLVAATAGDDATSAGLQFAFDATNSSLGGLILTTRLENTGWDCTPSGTIPTGLDLEGCRQ
ncbi:prepilin-type cleavage/methylation domain-containing protein [Grimontia hollisae]|uniref:pilin n=1 Tax=Grimontia hollisae TaxID=673 RepID=UPI00058F144B|nr:pilin [Grimontia hollisae]AMG30224.1 prepilin-type cleavage/methylation domain-containing protein [Grimontia hollisae]STO42450.1 Serogroup A1 [Grimontia hollisae]